MAEKKTRTLSVIPLRTPVMFPGVNLAFDAGRSLSLAAVDCAERNDKFVFLTKQKDPRQEAPSGRDLYAVGVVANLRQVTRLPGDRIRVYAEGIFRARAKEIRMEDGYLCAEVEEIVTVHGDPTLEEAYSRTAKELVKDIVMLGGKLTKDVEAQLSVIGDIDEYINVCAYNMRIRDDVKQALLEEEKLVQRLQLFERCLNDELEVARLERKIAQDVRKNIDQSQKEYYLREQLKAIHAALGDDVEENEKLREKILEKKLPPEVEEKALTELARMDKMPPSSPEYTVLRNYADWLIDLPWHEET